MSKNLLKITPVGGVGQIGSNMTLFKTKNDNILVDAGILFPSEDFFDINYLIPDLSTLLDDPPTDLVITHGHEDHIGAIRHIIEILPEINIWAPPFACELIRRKLDYQKISKKINQYVADTVLKFNDFNIHPIHVNHSIPDTFGLLFNCKEGEYSTLLLSDFKVDAINPYEKEFDFKKLENLTTKFKTKLLLADSTNILSTNLETPSEALVLESFKELFKRDKGTIFVTCFSSNTHRIQSAITAAKMHNKRVLLYGRSMINYANVAIERGLIEEGSFYEDQASLPNKDNLVVLLSGCQGDFRGSFRRVAKGEDTHFKPGADDLFVISSKAIPGNEKKISLLENEIIESGASIISSRDKMVHVSGHPGKEDLLKVYKSYMPTHIVPIHGESLFLKKHCEFINESYPQAKALRIHNFDSLIIKSSHEISFEKGKALEPVLIHGSAQVIERENISKRRKLATTGCIILSINKETLIKRNSSFKISLEGLPNIFNDELPELESFIASELSGRKIKLLDRTAEELRIAIRRYTNTKIGYKPVTIVHFV
jgi:ribonuclease J